MSIRFVPGEAQAAAIKKARASGQSLGECSNTILDQLSELEINLQLIMRTDDSPILIRLLARVERLRELRNMLELGSFNIELGRALDDAWRRLP